MRRRLRRLARAAKDHLIQALCLAAFACLTVAWAGTQIWRSLR